MTTLQYVEFELHIRPQGLQYVSTLVRSPVGKARASFRPPVDPKDLGTLRDAVEKAMLYARAAPRRSRPPEIEQVRRFGQELFDALFDGSLRGAFAKSWKQVQQTEQGMNILLDLPPSLLTLPWEFLFDTERGDFLVLSRYSPIVRYTTIKQPRRVSLHTGWPLRIVLVLATPQADAKYALLDVRQEYERIRSALGSLIQMGAVQLDVVEGANTLRKLVARLRSKPYHILHFVGHGGFDPVAEEGALVFEDEQRQGQLIGSQSLGRLLRDAHSVRLVFLNACRGTVADETDPFSSAASGLVRVGLPAVIAMQFEISDAGGVSLAREFYAALSDGLPVQAALGEARKALAVECPDSLEWATPVLFTHLHDSRIFEITKGRTVISAPPIGQQSLPALSKDRMRSPVIAPDGKTMVYVPKGPFFYGPDAKMRETGGFYMDQWPVSHREYGRFLKESGHGKPPHWPEKARLKEMAEHPVTFVSWHDAQAYAGWAGKRLPKEVEWEKAARGDTDARLWPWGDKFAPECANTQESHIEGTTPIGQYPSGASPYNLFDMAGNVWEWTASDFDDEGLKVQRGGSWFDPADQARCTSRSGAPPDGAYEDVGFRCVVDAPPRQRNDER